MINVTDVNHNFWRFGKLYDKLADSQRRDLYGTLGGMEVCCHLTHDNYEDPQVQRHCCKHIEPGGQGKNDYGCDYS